MATDKKRLLMQIEQTIKQVNHEVINPEIPELELSELEPVFRLTARTRMLYLKRFFTLAADHEENMPTQSQIDELADLRGHYEEMVAAAQAMEVAIQRGYLDVKIKA